MEFSGCAPRKEVAGSCANSAFSLLWEPSRLTSTVLINVPLSVLPTIVSALETCWQVSMLLSDLGCSLDGGLGSQVFIHLNYVVSGWGETREVPCSVADPDILFLLPKT